MPIPDFDPAVRTLIRLPILHTQQTQLTQFYPQILSNYSPPTKLLTLADLHLRERAFTTPIAATSSFPFLSPAGVLAYRAALFSDPVVENGSASWGTHALIIRNAGAHLSFLHDLVRTYLFMWSHYLRSLKLSSDVFIT